MFRMFSTKLRNTIPSKQGVNLINQPHRSSGAAILRDLIDGKITNDDFMSAFPRSNDLGVDAVFKFAWGQFSDLRTHTLTGADRPTPDRSAALERCWLFLNTNLEFEWPLPEPSVARGLLRMIGLGRLLRRSEKEYRSHGDFEVWPFHRKSDFETAVKLIRSTR
jgi:hypothetical protein